MSDCNHKWSEETHEGVLSRCCHVCNEWEVELELHALEAELTSTKAALIDAALIHAKLIEERDKLISERRQLRARVVECLPWVGFAPYPGTPEFKEMLAIRKNAEDTLEEVKPWNP